MAWTRSLQHVSGKWDLEGLQRSIDPDRPPDTGRFSRYLRGAEPNADTVRRAEGMYPGSSLWLVWDFWSVTRPRCKTAVLERVLDAHWISDEVADRDQSSGARADALRGHHWRKPQLLRVAKSPFGDALPVLVAIARLCQGGRRVSESRLAAMYATERLDIECLFPPLCEMKKEVMGRLSDCLSQARGSSIDAYATVMGLLAASGFDADEIRRILVRRGFDELQNLVTDATLLSGDKASHALRERYAMIAGM